MPNNKNESPHGKDNLNLGKAIKSGADRVRELKDKATDKLDGFIKLTQDLGRDISDGMQKILKENESRLKSEFEEKIKLAKENDQKENLKGLKEKAAYLKGLGISNKLYSILDTVRDESTGTITPWKFKFEKDGSEYTFNVSCDDESTDYVYIKIKKITGNKTEKFILNTKRGETYIEPEFPIKPGPAKESNSPLEAEDEMEMEIDEHVGPSDDYGKSGRFYNGEYLIMAGKNSTQGDWHNKKNLIGSIEKEAGRFETTNLAQLMNLMNNVVIPALQANAPAKSARTKSENKKYELEEEKSRKTFEEEKTTTLTNLKKGPTQPNAQKVFENAIYIMDCESFLQNAKLYKNEPYFISTMKDFTGLEAYPEAAAIFMQKFADFKDIPEIDKVLASAIITAPATFVKMIPLLESIAPKMVKNELGRIFQILKPKLIEARNDPHYHIHINMNKIEEKLYKAYELLLEQKNPIMEALEKSLPPYQPYEKEPPRAYRE